ncbi:hypothetical protein [Sorangium cellulosum]|uniref:hypothetical protein n=1 Tax=Sorangium cellulosum TaxID=56 RepID=UPI000779D466|nr:hypothetical protein [Sorangium cellulosum]
MRLEFIRAAGAEHCPDEQFLRAETARQMGGVDPYDANAPLTMTASIEHRDGELVGSMFLRDGNGRGLWADGFSSRKDCRRLVAAMALSIAVLLDDAAELPAAPAAPAAPAKTAEQPVPPQEPCSPDQPCPPQAAPAKSTTPAPLETPPARAPQSSAPPVPAERFRWVAGVDAVVGLGSTPGFSVGPALSISGRWPAWSVALEVRALSALAGKIEAVDVSVSTITTDVVFCLDRRILFACGLAELGVLRAAPSVPFDAASRWNLGAGMGVRAGIASPLARNVSARAHAEVVHPVVGAAILRHPGAPTPERPVWSAPALAVALGIGLRMNL